MAAAARGEPYRIAFGGRTELHYAPDVARAFIARRPPTTQGARRLRLRRHAGSMADIVAAIEAARARAAGRSTFDDVPLPFPEELPGERLDAAVTPLDVAVRETIEHFRAAVRAA